MTLKARIALAVTKQGRKALLPTLLPARMVVEPQEPMLRQGQALLSVTTMMWWCQAASLGHRQ